MLDVPDIWPLQTVNVVDDRVVFHETFVYKDLLCVLDIFITGTIVNKSSVFFDHYPITYDYRRKRVYKHLL